MALEAGVTIAAGADSNPIRENGFVEIEMLVQSGMTPAQALRAATVTAADLCGADDTGCLEPGKRADILIIDGDPLAEISNLRQTRAVLQAGQLVCDHTGRFQATAYAYPFLGV